MSRIPLNILSRECGTCQLCCEVLGVKDLGKPYYTRCKNQCGDGCAIYGDHPDDCKNYACLYRLGVLPDRPDQLGILFDLEEEGGENRLIVYETRPNRFNTLTVGFIQDTIKAISHLAKIKRVMCVRYGSRVGCGFKISDAYPNNEDVSSRSRIFGTADNYFYQYVEPGEAI